MPREMVESSIGGESYVFGYLTTSQSIKISAEVAALLLPALGKVLPTSGKVGDLLNAQTSALNLGGGLEALAQSMHPESLLSLIQRLCSCVMVKGSGLLADAAFEEHFKGAPGLALKVASKSFEVNCGDFFASAVSLGGLLKPTATTQAQAK